MGDRRKFLKDMALMGAGAFMLPSLAGCGNDKEKEKQVAAAVNAADNNNLITKNSGLQITGTFLDEISHDIPHQNWGEAEGDQDFTNMKNIGIEKVIMIRSEYRKFIT